MTAHPLKAQLEAACKDLWWSSEADYPVEVVWHDLSASAQAKATIEGEARLEDALIRQIADCGETAAIALRPFDTFFDKYIASKGWHTAEDKQQLAQLSQLKTLLSGALTHPQIYRCGEVEITLCIIGYAADGVLAGVKTRLVET